MRNILLLALIGLSNICAFAARQVKVIDNVVYRFDDGSTTASCAGFYTSSEVPEDFELVIKSSFESGGKTYTVTEITVSAFNQNDKITSLVLPETLITIGENAFGQCSNIKSIVIPNSVTTIGITAFAYCHAVESLTLGNSVSVIGERAFEDCENIPSLTIPSSVTTIERRAFSGLSKITSVTIPETVASLGSGVFSGCDNLSTVQLPSTLKVLPADFFFACAIQSLDLPATLEGIESRALANTNLKTITIPESVKKIGDGAFETCYSLNTIHLPSNLQEIGSGVFYYDNRLKDIYYPASTALASGADNSFETLHYNSATLHINESMANQVAATLPWSSFKNIEYIRNPVLTIKQDGGFIHLHEASGKHIQAVAADGYKFQSATLGSEDVTDQFDSHGHYVVPELNEDKNLTLVFVKDTTTGVERIAANPTPIKVLVSDGHVSVIGAESDTIVSVYDLNGNLVHKGIEKEFELSHKGVIILEVSGQSFKFFN